MPMLYQWEDTLTMAIRMYGRSFNAKFNNKIIMSSDAAVKICNYAKKSSLANSFNREELWTSDI